MYSIRRKGGLPQGEPLNLLDAEKNETGKKQQVAYPVKQALAVQEKAGVLRGKTKGGIRALGNACRRDGFMFKQQVAAIEERIRTASSPVEAAKWRSALLKMQCYEGQKGEGSPKVPIGKIFVRSNFIGRQNEADVTFGASTHTQVQMGLQKRFADADSWLHTARDPNDVRGPEPMRKIATGEGNNLNLRSVRYPNGHTPVKNG